MAGCGTVTRPLPPDYLPLPPGHGRAYRLAPTSPPVRARRPIDGLRCDAASTRRFGIHLELYARRLVVPIPAGIGIAPALRRRGAYVLGGACSYPIRTREPTGVFELTGDRLTLGALFDVWGQPLSFTRIAGFAGAVRAFLDGRPWRRSPRAIPLPRHAEIVLEIGAAVPPHPRYLFPPGL